jgi:hypothetical protein
MANRERGEMTLVAGEVVYTLKLTTNACCDLEERSGQLFDDVTRAVNKGSVKAVRWLLWAALQAYHADTVKGPPDVGPIIDAAGGLLGVVQQLTAFMQLNTDEEGAPEGSAKGGTRPPAAEVSAGGGSTSTPGSSALPRSSSGRSRSASSGANSPPLASDSVISKIAMSP